MRKITAALAASLLCLMLIACGDEKPSSTTAPSGETTIAGTTSETEDTAPTTVGGETTVSGVTSPSSASKKTTTTTQKKTTVQTLASDKYDIAWQSNPGAVAYPVASELDAKAASLRASVVNAKDNVKASGTKYYVSSKTGDDSNDGKSKNTPWRTIKAVAQHGSQMKAGDAVLFERGSLFRITDSFRLKSGVTYAAYGSGNKPCVYGSAKNYVNGTWTKKGPNLWYLEDAPDSDVGLIVFNHGEAVGYKKDAKANVTKNYDFWCDKQAGNRVWMYLDKDPATSFKSIEIGTDNRMFLMETGVHDVTIENICFKYTGAHAVDGAGRNKNVTVRNCEFGFIGGCYLSGYSKANTRYGNAIEFMGDSNDILAESNWIYQIYDSGITYQGNGKVNTFTVKNNLIEYCGMGGFEYWGSDVTDVLIENNMFRFAGYGFGGKQRPDKEMTAHIESNGKPIGAGYNHAVNFVIKNNIFELSTYQLINATSSAGTPPVLEGNTYIQKKGQWLGYYETNKNVKFSDTGVETLKTVWGDSTATVVFK